MIPEGAVILFNQVGDIIKDCLTLTVFPEQTSGKVKGLREGV